MFDLDKGGRAGHVLIFEGAFELEPKFRKGVDLRFGYCIDKDFLTVVSFDTCKAMFGRTPIPGKSIVLEVRCRKQKD
jgi:hypothetical protein